MKKNALLLLLCVIVLWSCSENDLLNSEEFTTKSSIMEVEDLVLAAYFSAHDGVLQLRHDVGSQSDTNFVNLGTTFARIGGGENSIFSPGSRLTINNSNSITLSEDLSIIRDNPSLWNAFGRQLSFTISDEHSDSTRFNTMYLPKFLEPNFHNLPINGLDSYPIKWNGDVQNTKGVYIIVQYDPANNPSLSDLSPGSITEYKHFASDDGSYKYNNSDFPNIPPGALVNITLIRGIAAEIVDNSSERDIVLAYTTAHSFVITPD